MVTDCLLTLKLEEALSIGHETIDMMGGYTSPPSARNYEIWLNYKLGQISDLRRDIDRLIASGGQFTDEIHQQLHEKYFSHARLTAQMTATGERIARELTELLGALAAAGDNASAYGEVLEAGMRKLEQRGSDPNAIREVVSGIASATLRMAGQNRQLTDQLKSSSAELESMRVSLREARAEALSDALTGIANRKLFDETLRKRLAMAERNKTPLCLMLVDIDHFKRFNDTWGHQTGDQVIRYVASTLQRHCPAEGLAARYGGEEFALILFNQDMTAAREAAERLRTIIESKALVRKSTGDDLGRISVSMGVAKARPGEHAAALIERADLCLYASKRAGRNRVTTDRDLQNMNAA